MPTASWNQLERAIEHLHASARQPLGVREFYRILVAEASAALDAAGGAAWRPGAGGRPELICQTLPDDGKEANWSARLERIGKTLAERAATIEGHDAEYDLLRCPVAPMAGAAEASGAMPTAVIELWMPHGASPAVRQGWLDFAAALADVAADFHARDELRRMRGASALHGHAVELVRRVATPRTLVGAAFEAANEGRRLLGCERVSIVVRRGGRWRLIAASGVDVVERRTEFARRSQRLAEQVARWGEPIEHPGAATTRDGEGELPPRVAQAIEDHVDHSHARELACAPIKFPPAEDGEDRTAATPFDVVFIGERVEGGGALRDPLVELGELCAPALARALELDRFPVRSLLRWSRALGRLREPGRLARTLLALCAIAGGVAALTLIPCDFVVEAPARLATVVERDVFATASGAVAEVRVTQGQVVAAGDVLIVLSDPELALKLQETRGEIDAARKRLEALAVSRTDRKLIEDHGSDRLPMAAEQRELEERIASLELQRKLLETRREALTLRSPRTGQVITRDVQSLLESRPVERGQSLLTIADLASGWELRADVPQRQIGHVVAALADSKGPVGASYRLAGDVAEIYSGHVVEISSVAPIDAEGLRDEAAPVTVRISVDGDPPPAARPGMTATVRIDCGQRTLGYVWLHDVGATLYRWATF
jgi:multidrug efflux pump subunit AcrA (membrane-fusion protein)